MPGICLPPALVNKFTDALRTGKIVPEKLGKMTSDERRAYFKDIVGEGNAKAVNSLFESKMLLKNQKFAYTNWAKKVAGLTPEVKRDLITRISKLDHVLNPAEERGFLKDLASTKLGLDVTHSEASNIAALSSNLKTAAESKATDGTFKSLEQRMAYGKAHYDLANYVQGLKDVAAKQPARSLLSHPVQGISKVANLSRSFKTVGDLSIAFRNGFKMMAIHPTVWAKAFKTSFTSMFKTLGGKDAWREVQAYVRSSPYYDDMVKANLLPKSEEAYPVSIPEKIPILGRVAKSTQVGYEAMAQMMRVDGYTKIIQGAEKAGVDITDAKFKTDLGKLVGALTNRGSLGAKLEPSANTINAFLFSPRALASTLHLATDWARTDYHSYIRRQAGYNVLKVGAVVAGTLAIANALAPGSVEQDERSANFGKIKIGDTAFDVTGGMGTLLTLGARMYKNSTKSTTTGAITPLGSGFGQTSRMDVIMNFFENKAAPAPSVLIALAKGKDGAGQPLNPKSVAEQGLIPLGVETGLNAKTDKNPKNPNAVVTMLLDDLGITASVQNPLSNGNKTTLDTTTSKSMLQFKKNVGQQKFDQLGQQYDKAYNTWLGHAKNDPKFKTGSPTYQADQIKGEKSHLTKTILKGSGYKVVKGKKTQLSNYGNEWSSAAKKSLLDSIH